MENLFMSVGIPSSSLITRRDSSPSLVAHHCIPKRHPSVVSVIRSSLPGSELAEKDVWKMFLKERQENGDFVSKISDVLWKRNDLILDDVEDGDVPEDHRQKEVLEDGSSGGFIKLTQTQVWIAGDTVAPVNRRLTLKERQNNSEKIKKLNFLKYEALKRELMLLTAGIGVPCTVYCWATLSLQASISYAAGVLLSCLYLQLLCNHADNLSKEAVPTIFLRKRSKKFGIRSEDLEEFFERTIKGCSVALSSPRLVFPAVVYGFWALSHKFLDGIFDFQLVPAMFGLFAYKAAALVQVYRDNEDLRFVFPDDEIPYSN